MTRPTLSVSGLTTKVVASNGSVVLNVPIARREGTNHSYIARHINLTLLAPEIVAAILDETLSEGVQLMSLAINPPVGWKEQIKSFSTPKQTQCVWQTHAHIN